MINSKNLPNNTHLLRRHDKPRRHLDITTPPRQPRHHNINEKGLLKKLENRKINEEWQCTLGREEKMMLDFQLGSWTKIRKWRRREKKREDERRWMKKMKPRLLCPWFFILGFIEEIPDGILNINIFKFFIGDSVCEGKVKYYWWLFILSVILLVKE
jgi:hypothetical protein